VCDSQMRNKLLIVSAFFFMLGSVAGNNGRLLTSLVL
jgi:hypothetical protein